MARWCGTVQEQDRLRGSTWIVLVAVLALLLSAGCMGPAPTYDAAVGRDTNLWPLVDISYGPDGVDRDILWPVFAFDNKIDHKLYAVRPLVMVETDADNHPRKGDFLWPIFHAGRTGSRRELAMRPLFGVWHDPENEIIDVDALFPIAWWRRTPKRTRFQFRPLVWYDRSSSPDAGHFHIFPLFGRSWEVDGQRNWLLTPFVTWSRYGGAEPRSSFSFFPPLIHFSRTVDSSTSGVIPFYYHHKSPTRETKAVSPFYWRHRRLDAAGEVSHRLDVLFPLYARDHSVRRDRTTQYFLLNTLVLGYGKNYSRIGIAWPFFSYVLKRSTHRRWLFPFYWQFGDEDEDLLIVGPYFSSHDTNEEKTHLWPFYGYERHYGRQEYSFANPLFKYKTGGPGHWRVTVGGPLFQYSRRGDSAYRLDFLRPFGKISNSHDHFESRLLPLFAYKSEEDRSKIEFLPPFSEFTHGPSGRSGYLFPVFSYDLREDYRRYDLITLVEELSLIHYRAKGEAIDFHFLGPVTTYSSSADETDFRVLWKFIQYSDSTEAERTKFIFNPLYRYEKNKRGDTYWAFFGGLIGHKTEGGEGSLKLFWMNW